MHENQRVAEMVDEVLSRQAGARAERAGESHEQALTAVRNSRAGQHLKELRNGPHRDERADRWQIDCAQKRARERSQARQEERKQLERDAAWEQFMQTEQRELELRKDGQLKKLLGEPLPGEPLEALWRLAYEDRRQAEDGLVALMSNGKLFYKPLDGLSEEDIAGQDRRRKAADDVAQEAPGRVARARGRLFVEALANTV